ncbi:MAG: hypothetical protein ACI87H_000411, partial [Gammaproteobacteria bacterium]
MVSKKNPTDTVAAAIAALDFLPKRSHTSMYARAIGKKSALLSQQLRRQT